MSSSLPAGSEPRIWTLGHSNRSLEEFLALLEGAGIEQIADVRRFPGSRRHPQFGAEALAQALAAREIGYAHFPALGGRRGKPAEDSPNTGWRVAAFAAYADYMGSDEFRAALAALTRFASEHVTAIMCSEALPWRCHRRLVADALIARGWRVFDVMSSSRSDERHLTAFARLDGHHLTYPAGDDATPRRRSSGRS